MWIQKYFFSINSTICMKNTRCKEFHNIAENFILRGHWFIWKNHMQKTIYKFHNSNIEFHHLLLFNSQYRYCPTRRKNFKSKTYIKAKNSQMVHLINKTKMFIFLFLRFYLYFIFLSLHLKCLFYQPYHNLYQWFFLIVFLFTIVGLNLFHFLWRFWFTNVSCSGVLDVNFPGIFRINFFWWSTNRQNAICR